MMYLWRLAGTDIFEFSVVGDPPGELANRRELVEALTGELFPPAGVCPVVTQGHEGDPEWLWLGEIEPVWRRHPLECLKALDRNWDDWFERYCLEHGYREISAVLSRHIRKGY